MGPYACMQALAWFPPGKTRQVEMLQQWTLAFMKCSMAHVQEDCQLDAHLQVPPHLLPLPAPTGLLPSARLSWSHNLQCSLQI